MNFYMVLSKQLLDSIVQFKVRQIIRELTGIIKWKRSTVGIEDIKNYEKSSL